MIKVKTHQIFKVTGQGHWSKVNIAGQSFAHFCLYLDNQLRYAKTEDIVMTPRGQGSIEVKGKIEVNKN